MEISEMIRGESKNIEYKVDLPDKSEKYIKTVVAYANSQGGKLIFGIDDETYAIIGIDETVLFQRMDSIANAISDSCEPQIIPEIEPHTIDGKTIIVTIFPGVHRPFYLRSRGVDNGTYIRIAATTRLASKDKIKELQMEGAKISWDELICVGYKTTSGDIEHLCREMNNRRE